MNFYNEIKTKLLDNEIYSKVKDYSKERYKVITYFEIGKLLNEAGGKYGDKIIEEYSKKLVLDVNKKYNKRTLFRMRQFYRIFSNEKVSPLVTQLTWTHYIILLSIKDFNKIYYYIKQVTKRNLTKRQLEEIIKNKEYERLPEETKSKLINKEELKIQDSVPNPIIIRNRNNYDELSEKVLQRMILEDIESFMKELGNSFCFIGSEYSIKLGDSYNYIDLLLFNIDYNCYVVVELKVTELKKEHIGQVQVYMNYIYKSIRKINQDKTIGIIICKENNKYIIKYSSDERIVSRTYMLV